MPRIRKEDHARILQLVEGERRAVREIAAEYGCTPATIYSLLTKLRRSAGSAAPEERETQPPLALEEPAAPDAAEVPPAAPEPRVAAAVAASETRVPAPRESPKVVTFEPAPPPPPRAEPARPATASLGAKLAKPGMALLMRTPDGEETMTPFRSIDDLLSAIKPILRAGARSPEPVWFSLQPVDLSTIDVDAA
jgi:transposase-like protein